MNCFHETVHVDINQSPLVHLYHIEVVRSFSHHLIGPIPIGASLIAKIFTLATDPHAVPFLEVWQHPSTFVVLLFHHLWHMNIVGAALPGSIKRPRWAKQQGQWHFVFQPHAGQHFVSSGAKDPAIHITPQYTTPCHNALPL